MKKIILGVLFTVFSVICIGQVNNYNILDHVTAFITGGTIDNTAIGATTPSTGAFTTLSANSTVKLSGLQTTGTIANSLCTDASGNLISNSGINCFGGGSGSGTVSSGTVGQLGVYTGSTTIGSTTGIFAGNNSIIFGSEGTATGYFQMQAATGGGVTTEPSPSQSTFYTWFLPPVLGSSGNVMTLGSGGTTSWSPPAVGLSVIPGYINGYTLSNDGTTPNSVLDIAVGYASDSTNASMITGTTFKKSTAGSWTAGTGNNGMGTGLTIAASTWYHVFAIIKSGAYDVYFDTSATAANAPSGTTYFRRIGSFLTDGSVHILGFNQQGNRIYWGVQKLDINAVNTGSAITGETFSVPLGIVTVPLLTTYCAITCNLYLWSPIYGTTLPQQITSGAQFETVDSFITNTSSQLYMQSNAAATIYTTGWIDPHIAPNF